MTIEELREDLSELITSKNYDYSDPEVVSKSLELEKKIFESM